MEPTKLHLFEMLHEKAFKPWPTACIPGNRNDLILSEDNGMPVFYGIELIVTIAKATGCSYYITIDEQTGCPVVRVYK